MNPTSLSKFFFISFFFSFFYLTIQTKTDNWAIIVDTSRFWFNYRHSSNSLAVYRSVKRLGIPDSHIILMLADDFACNPRNPFPGKIFVNRDRKTDVYGTEVEVDYRGEEVTVHNVIRVLTDRVEKGTPSSKRLLTTKNSNILIYMTGHGGDDFLKFQEQEELTSDDLADALHQMNMAQRYNEILFIVDTCQGATLYRKVYSPNVIAIASSLKGEDSLSHHADKTTGVHVVDRYTFHLLEFLEKISIQDQNNQNKKQKTMKDLFGVCPKSQCISTSNHKVFNFSRNAESIPVIDFFGGTRELIKVDSLFTMNDQEFLDQMFA